MTYAFNNIPVALIEDNKKNFYSIEGIAELAENIRTVGLLHPIRAVRVNGGYRCVDGHRRLNAYRLLAEEDEGFQNIPTYLLPVMEDLEEQTMLLMSNANNRQMTTADLHRQEAALRQLLEARKAAGKRVPKNLSQYMASVLGVSRNEVSRMHVTNTQLIPEGKQLLEDGKLNASTAYEMARRPEAEQRAAIAPLKAVAPIMQQLNTELEAAQDAERKRIENLIRLAEKYTAKYMPRVLLYRLSNCFYRSDVIASLKMTVCKCHNGYTGSIRYYFTPKGVSIGDDSGKVDATITEFADAVLVTALRAYAGKQIRETDKEKPAENVSKMDAGWKTGHPESPCWCVCRLFSDGMKNGIYRRLWWGGRKWNGLGGEDAPVTHWILAPEVES